MKKNSTKFKGFGARMRAAREALGMSEAEMARRMGTSHATVSDYERGKRNPPKASALLKLHSILGCSIEWLLTGELVLPQDSRYKVVLEIREAREKEKEGGPREG